MNGSLRHQFVHPVRPKEQGRRQAEIGLSIWRYPHRHQNRASDLHYGFVLVIPSVLYVFHWCVSLIGQSLYSSFFICPLVPTNFDRLWALLEPIRPVSYLPPGPRLHWTISRSQEVASQAHHKFGHGLPVKARGPSQGIDNQSDHVHLGRRDHPSRPDHNHRKAVQPGALKIIYMIISACAPVSNRYTHHRMLEGDFELKVHIEPLNNTNW